MSHGPDIRPFKISVPEKDLVDLKARLLDTRWPDDRSSSGWDHGADLDWVKETAKRWADAYDWRTHEARLNEFPQFAARIDGQTIHYIHVRSPEANALPLILTHGWPSTFADFAEMIGPLTNPRAYGGDASDAFDVVIPSIPGFGFSVPLESEGWDSKRIANAWMKLMLGLGYSRYGAHGGDAGSFITRQMGITASPALVGIHVLEIFDFPNGTPGELDDLTDKDREQIAFMGGYNDASIHQRVHQKRPLTVGYGLSDSPVGQLAWIGDNLMGLGKFGPPEPRDIDALLTTVSLYWFTNTAESSARWYYEDAKSGTGAPTDYNPTPTGVALFPFNLLSIRKVAERLNNIVHWASYDKGGHFAALDVPDLLVGDLREFFRPLR